MDFKTQGGPAFPNPRSEANLLPANTPLHGISVRDYFAAAALTGYIARNDGSAADAIVKLSYETADLMLRQRTRG
ncbi:hypothetical protein SAMN05216551_109149 [Chitinasiproducens palmae]|uniref:Uncharacterized protein n=1 Tax=Chitinasiproducens palmae TaxID=1770053 RepID=A0A1H2PT36_9BURK|nr:hypothetical protein SAMN05216551_109149 [Chitinasiproducens palmae]